MGIKKGQYTKEQKEELVKALLSGQTALELGREYNISPGLINRWRRQYLNGQLSENNNKLQQEIAKLEQMIGKLTMENYILKKEKEYMIQTKKEELSIVTGTYYRVYPNLIKDKIPTGINQVWCSDITYISILFGFVYLAVIIDIYSRKIVGYAIGKFLSPQLAIAALNMAIASRNTDQLIHHSDQGIQYTCKDYIKILKDNGIRISMSVKGNPYDNAYAESLIKTL